MSENRSGAVLDRLWNKLEERYGATEGGCGCVDPSTSVEALRESQLTRADLDAYRDGELSMADLVSALDADLDPGRIDDVDDLAAALERAGEPDAATTTDPS